MTTHMQVASKGFNYVLCGSLDFQDSLTSNIAECDCKKCINLINTPIMDTETPFANIPEDVIPTRKIKMDREQILNVAKDYVTKDRNISYGDPEDSFKKIADLWNVYLGASPTALDNYDVACMMLLMKVARMKNRPSSADSAIDAAGYAACAGEILENQTK